MAALLGFVFFIAFSAYALALWYGSVRIIAGAMNGGDVVTVRLDAVRPWRCHSKQWQRQFARRPRQCLLKARCTSSDSRPRAMIHVS